MKVLHIVGARPNFMKAAPVIAALNDCDGILQKLVHTGQHYDGNMSEIFFNQLQMPKPGINLEVGSGSHALQTAKIMMRIENVLSEQKPKLVSVYGDVNSTAAATIVCSKLLIPVGHVEAGLRSFDRTMPEEINRLLTDQISNLLFTPSVDGNADLLHEGISPEKMHFVGNVMIDTLVRFQNIAAERHRLMPMLREDVGYALVTLHRPSNVDEPEMLTKIMDTLEEISKMLPVIFPIHPRTRQRLNSKFKTQNSKLSLVKPIGYLEFLSLQKNAAVLITDSGGIQEETTYLGGPCLTVRENTERPVTIEKGTNVLVGRDMARLKAELQRILDGNQKKGTIPDLWDGKAGERIADIIVSFLEQ